MIRWLPHRTPDARGLGLTPVRELDPAGRNKDRHGQTKKWIFFFGQILSFQLQQVEAPEQNQSLSGLCRYVQEARMLEEEVLQASGFQAA